MSLYILDTDHVSLFQRRQAHVTRRIAMMNPRRLGVTVITV